MERYQNNALVLNAGTVAPGCTVTVYNSGTLVLASIYGDDLTPPTAKANPFTADVLTGYFYFYAPDGDYDVKVSGSGISSPITWGDISFASPGGIKASAAASFPTAAATSTTAYLRRQTDGSRSLWMDNGADWISLTQRVFDVMQFGAKGDNVADDTAAIQAAIDAATNGTVVLPQPSVAYRITDSLVIERPLRFIGLGNYVRVRGDGLVNGEYLIEVDGTAFPNLENVEIANIGLEQNGAGPYDAGGIRINRVAESRFRDIRVKESKHGLYITGDRTYNNYYENIVCGADIQQDGVQFDGVHGGAHTFIGGNLTGGRYGLYITGATGSMSSVNLYGTNIEGCGTNGVLVDILDIAGLGFFGCRSEKNNGADDWVFMPPAGGYVKGLCIQGGYFETDGGDHAIVLTGAGGGDITGVSITGCVAEDYGVAFIEAVSNGGQGSLILGNTIRGGASIVTSVQPGMLVLNNIDDGGSFTGNQAWNPPVVTPTVNAAAADPATTMALVNQLRALLIANGMAV